MLNLLRVVSLCLRRCQGSLAFTVCILPFNDYYFLSSTEAKETLTWDYYRYLNLSGSTSECNLRIGLPYLSWLVPEPETLLRWLSAVGKKVKRHACKLQACCGYSSSRLASILHIILSDVFYG